MAKITQAGGASIAGFTDDTERIRTAAADRAPAGDPEPDRPQPAVTPEPVLRPLPFNPANYTVAEVQDLLQDMSPADAEAVRESERNGLKRKTLVGE